MTTELAKRAVACKHWRWMPGMLARVSEEYTVRYFGNDDWFDVEAQELLWSWPEPSQPTPDLTDPATLGCLLALVREAWEMTTIYVEANFGPNDVYWQAFTPDRAVCGNTEAEALVAALEAVP